MPREVDADEEEFIFKAGKENGGLVGGCSAEAYEYHRSGVFLNTLRADERWRQHGLGPGVIREVECIAREKDCRVVTLGSAGYMAGPFFEKGLAAQR